MVMKWSYTSLPHFRADPLKAAGITHIVCVRQEVEKNFIRPHHEGELRKLQRPESHDCHVIRGDADSRTISNQPMTLPPAGQCEYLVVSLADSLLESLIPKARQCKQFIDK